MLEVFFVLAAFALGFVAGKYPETIRDHVVVAMVRLKWW